VQPLICAYHLPRCENGSLFLPSQEMCRVALGPCRLLGLRDEGFPAFLNCNDTETFPPLCKVSLVEILKKRQIINYLIYFPE
jgi:hypothetical protein